MANDTRAPREQDSRDATKRVQQWAPPSLLPDPPALEGFTHRWIRTSLYGASDPANVSKQFREGWEPVKASDPIYADMMTARDANSRYKDGVEIGGLLLCKIPTEVIMQRQRHYQRLADAQINAVDNNFMRENDPRMPLLQTQRRTRVTFGGGSKPEG